MGSPGGGERVKEMCRKALAMGYRHFDTANGYANEEKVGEAIAESEVPRGQLYVTTKLGNGDHHRVREAFEESLTKLNCGYVDMYLMHWPHAVINGKTLAPEESPTIIDTWVEMEKLLETGKVKSIGVSNFSIKILSQLLDDPRTKVVPATNQVEMHPCLPQTNLKQFCESKGILLTAYSPLGRPPAPSTQAEQKIPLLLNTDAVTSIAQKHNSTPAQVLLAWGVQRGTVVIPKSEDEARMKANLTLIGLDQTDVKALEVLHMNDGMHRSLLAYHSVDPGKVFGWSYAQLGWNMKEGGIVA